MPDIIHVYDSARPIWWEDNLYTYHVPERLLCGPAGSTCELMKIYIPDGETEPFQTKIHKIKSSFNIKADFVDFFRLSEFRKPVIDGEI